MDFTTFSPSSALVTVVLLGLGLQGVPPNLVLNGLAIVLSMYIMYPTSQVVMDNLATIPDVGESTDSMLAAANSAKEPFRDFMLKHSRIEDSSK